MSEQIEVWDLPLRLFHWALALAVVALVVTGEIGGNLIDWHGRIGVIVLGLLLFRLLWGVVGSRTARFTAFAPTTRGIAAYLKGEWNGIGHNPLGALAVFALLGVLLSLVTTGLFANDDIAFQGPLASVIKKSTSDAVKEWHETIFTALVVLVVLHVAAIAFYAKVKGKDLVTPMITGKTNASGDTVMEQTRYKRFRFAAAALVAIVLAWSVGSGYLAHQWVTPPTASTVTTPDF